MDTEFSFDCSHMAAGRIALFGLDLDDIGTEIPQSHAGDWALLKRGNFDYFDSRERSL
jgi:hypothetical protein